MYERKTSASLHETVAELNALLQHHRALDVLAAKQAAPQRHVGAQLQHRQNIVDLQRRVRTLHPADLAFVLESMAPDKRSAVWEALDPQQAADVLVELDPSVRTPLAEDTDRQRLREIGRYLDADDFAWATADLPESVREDLLESLSRVDRHALEQAAYPDDSVGHFMSTDVAAVRESLTVEESLQDLRGRGQLPVPLDRLFTVDSRNVLRGSLPLENLLLAQPSTRIVAITDPDPLSFRPGDPVAQAARAFERYDLLSAPVINDRGKLIGRLKVDAVVDFIRGTADRDALAMAGLQGAEDLFAPVWQSTRNRSLWLSINLVTAFAATRFIGLFENTIHDVIALATLMPIVASIGGNTGNQTIALVIRGLGFDQIPPGSNRHLLKKETGISLLNGLLWGGLAGAAAAAMYQHARLGLVMTLAIVLNLIIAAAAGVTIPLGLQRMGRDPAHGASVLLTFVTDSMGFFLFLGLARLLL